MRPTSYPLAPAVLSLEQKAAYYQMRADLMRDRAPVDTFERMLVDQAALAWCRLQSSQANYFRLLNFHTHEQSVIHDCSAGESGKAITLAFTGNEDRKGFQLALRDLRDSENAWYRAARQLDRSQTDRDKRAHRQTLKTQTVPQAELSHVAAHPATLVARPDASHLSATLEPLANAPEINCGSSILPDPFWPPRPIVEGIREEGHRIRPLKRISLHRDRAA